MKKLRKSITLFVVAAMLMSTLSVSASVVEIIPERQIVSQTFTGLSALPQGWSVKRPTSKTVAFNAEGVTTNEKSMLWLGKDAPFDTQGNGYTADFSFSKMASGSMVMVVGGNEKWYKPMNGYQAPSQASSKLIASEDGYTIQLQNIVADDSISLYKNGVPIISASIAKDLKNTQGKAPGSVGGLKSFDVSLHVGADKVVLTVVGKASSTYTGIFEYADTEPVTSGYTGIYYAYTTPSETSGTVKSVALSKDSVQRNFDRYFFEKHFLPVDTIENINNLGFSFSGVFTPVVTSNGIQLCEQGSKGSVVILDDYIFDGEYNFETSLWFSFNNASVYFNYQNEDNYYSLEYGKLRKEDNTVFYGYSLKKCVNGVISTVANSEDFSVRKKYTFQKVDKPLELSIKNASDSLTVNVTGYKDDESFKWEYKELSPSFTSGKIGIRAFATGETYLKSLKAYSKNSIYTSGSAKGEEIAVCLPYMPWTEKNGKAITALYKNSPAKPMIYVSANDISNLSVNPVTVIPSEYNSGNVVVRTYLWNNFEEMIPLSYPIDLIPQ